jgi:type IV secretion system protein VirB2
LNRNSDIHQHAALLAAVLIVASCDVVLAQASGGSFQPLNSAFKSVLDFMTGTFATTGATIAVCAAGFLALTSRIPWGWCFSIVVGVALIFGGSQIVQTLSAGAGGN